MPNQHYQDVQDAQMETLMQYEEACIETYGQDVLHDSRIPLHNKSTNSLFCPAFWDKIYCWPHTPANSSAVISCPSYFTGFTEGNATRTCTENGTWFINEQDQSWTNYTACIPKDETTIIFRNLNKTNIPDKIETLLPIAKIISQTGYATSLITLVIAFNIMFLIKKLHCARNILHMNLFASYIFRAFIQILKDILFVDGIGTPRDLRSNNGNTYFNADFETNNFECKLLSSLVQYFTTANYSWILMEGLYLNNLIFRALFADSSKNILPYIILGWGLPILVIVPWIVARLIFEDNFCWTTHDNFLVNLIIIIPTIIAVLINLILFVIISKVLYTKLKSPVNEDSRMYLKWAKSTLVLVPLFGVHYAVFLVFYFNIKVSPDIELTWLISDLLFGSFQGFFVAVLYCFLNGEVKSELKPLIKSVLTYLATNNCTKYCFPCRDKYLRSVVGRTSVCTTMSCSSLFNNGVVHRNSKSKWDIFPKSKHNSVSERGKDHSCQNSTRRDSRSHSRCSQNSLHLLNRQYQPHTFGSAETTLSVDQKQEKCPTDSHILLEEEICMLTRNF